VTEGGPREARRRGGDWPPRFSIALRGLLAGFLTPGALIILIFLAAAAVGSELRGGPVGAYVIILASVLVVSLGATVGLATLVWRARTGALWGCAGAGAAGGAIIAIVVALALHVFYVGGYAGGVALVGMAYAAAAGALSGLAFWIAVGRPGAD
jgi:hypothetical protein